MPVLKRERVVHSAMRESRRETVIGAHINLGPWHMKTRWKR